MKICDCGNEFTPASYGNGAAMCNSCRANRRRWQLKLKCVEYLGGECSECGYNKCPEALDFHHVNPEDKDFALSGRLSKSWDVIELELQKCKLLCANCHREEHWQQKQHKGYMKSYEPYVRQKAERVRRKVAMQWPTIPEIIELVQAGSFREASRKLGVCDNAIRKHLRKHGIDPKSIRSILDNGKK
jgi:hypothetical protein